MSRTNIDIDDSLMREAMEATGQKTKKGAVEVSLRRMVLISRQLQALENLRGIGWDGDLDEMRRNWSTDDDHR